MVVDGWGTGREPMLLLHGFTHAGRSWRVLERHWSGAFSVFAPDLPGPPSAPDAPRTFETVVDALAELLESQWPGRPVSVLGYSQGARLALALALNHPDKVRRLIVESGSPGLSSETERSARRGEDEARARRIEHTGVEHFIEAWEALPLFAGIRALPEARRTLLDQVRRSHRAEDLTAALRILGQGSQPDYRPALPRLGPPALFVSGKRDEKFTRLATEMAASVPRGRALSLDCGHAPHLESPAYPQAVLDFVEAPVLGETP